MPGLLAKYELAIDGDERDDEFRVFFGYKYVRMLMGYRLENPIKGLLLSGSRKDRYVNDDRISFGKKGHDLQWLLGELEVIVEGDVAFFVDAWTVSAVWFGKFDFRWK